MDTSRSLGVRVSGTLPVSRNGGGFLRRVAFGLKAVLGFGLLASGIAVNAGTGRNALAIKSYSMAPGVSYSSSAFGVAPTLTAYLVTFESTSSSGANNIWLTAKATSSLGAPVLVGFKSATAVDFTSAAASPCSAAPTATDPSLVKCELGGLAPGAKAQVVLEFKVPTAPANSAGSQIRFDWSVSSGQGGADNQPSDSNTTQKGSSDTAVTTAVSTPTKSQVQSYVSVPEAGIGQLSSLLSDSSAKTTVDLPKSAGVFIEQNETSNKGSCSPLYAKCLATELRIKDPITAAAMEFGFLKITLERATSTLKNPGKADIANAVLTYTDDLGNKSDITEFCEGTQGPVNQVNCIVRAADGKKGTVAGNAWVFVLRALKNGFREF